MVVRLVAVALLVCCSGFSVTLSRLACGGPGGVDPQGNSWSPDASFATGGTNYSVPGSPVPYSSLRYTASTMTYNFTVAPGSYSIILKFLEPRAAQTAGLRVFSVTINGVVALPSLDVFVSAGGALKPWDSGPLPAVAGADGRIVLTFAASVGNSVVSGVELDGPAPPSPLT